MDHSIAESRYYEESKDHGVRNNSSRQSNGYFLRLGVSSKVWEKIVIVQCDLIYAVHHWLWSYSQDHFNINRYSKNDWKTIGEKCQFIYSVVSDSATPWTVVHQASLSITNSWNLLKLISIELVMQSNHLIPCHPLLLPSIFPSIRVFSNESVLRIRWPKYWSFSFSVSSSNVYSGLISFRMDWFDLLTVQGILKSLL